MLANFLGEIGRFIINTIDAMGYPGVFLLMVLSSSAVPLPSEIVMPFSGVLVGKGRFNLFLISLCGATGSLLGSLLLYLIGSYLGRAFLLRYGKYFLFSPSELSRAERFFWCYGWVALFFGQFIPLIRSYIALPAGLGKLNIGITSATCFTGSLLWSFSLAFLGFKLGENWRQLEPYFRKFDYLVLFAILLLVFLAIWHRIKR
ncbi:MAG: DedA family protein [bacterium]